MYHQCEFWLLGRPVLHGVEQLFHSRGTGSVHIDIAQHAGGDAFGCFHSSELVLGVEPFDPRTFQAPEHVLGRVGRDLTFHVRELRVGGRQLLFQARPVDLGQDPGDDLGGGAGIGDLRRVGDEPAQRNRQRQIDPVAVDDGAALADELLRLSPLIGAKLQETVWRDDLQRHEFDHDQRTHGGERNAHPEELPALCFPLPGGRRRASRAALGAQHRRGGHAQQLAEIGGR